MRQYRGSSGDERRAERRAQFIAAAIQVYGEVGYANATVRRICAAAKLTERYFYESFSNGEELLAAAFQEIADRLNDAIDAVPLDDGRGVGVMKGKLTAYFDTLRAHPAESRVFLVELSGVSDNIDRLFGEAMDRFAMKLVPLATPDRDPDMLRMLTRATTGGLLHLARYWIDNGYQPSTGEVVTAALALCQGITLPEANPT